MSRRTLTFAALILFATALAWTRDRARPFIGHHDSDSIYWIAAAENYARYGLWDTRLQQIVDPVALPRAEWDVSRHHPPGISLITAAGIAVFGSSALAIRLVPLGASWIAAALLFRLAQALYGDAVALLALAAFGLTPLMIYYSAKIGHEQYTLPLMLAALLVARRDQTRPGLPAAIFALGLVGGFISWAWFLFLALLAAYILKTRGRRSVMRLGALWAGGIAGGIGLLALFAWQMPDFAGVLAEAFTQRAANSNQLPVTLAGWLRTVPPTLIWLPTPVVGTFAILGLRRRARGAGRGLLVVPALTALIYCLVFWQATYYHDYLIYYLVPPLCVWASVGFLRVLHAYGQPPRPLWRAALALVIVPLLASSLRGAQRLYTIDTYPERYTWGQIAAAATRPDELIITNLPVSGHHIAYYARRALRDGVPPEEVLSPARAADWGFYIFFQKRNIPLPEWLQSLAYQYDPAGNCYLIDLKP